MFLGALIDAGLDAGALVAELSRLPLEGYRLEVERVNKAGVGAIQFKVLLSDKHSQIERLADSEYSEVAAPNEESGNEPGGHPHIHLQQRNRRLADILAIISGSDLSAVLKERAGAIFTRLAEAEASVHGVAVDQVHFHEVGATDAIIDIVGAAAGIELLGIGEIYASPLHLGSGFVRSQHGLLPVPAPVTAYLLSGLPVYTSSVTGELVTPTGAAILSTLARGFGPMPPMTVQAVGYGAGRRERAFPNALRVFLGETYQSRRARAAKMPTEARAQRDPFPVQHNALPGPAGYHDGEAVVIEANIDDMNPQLFEHLAERLLEAGALDVLWVPAQMKKGRPGALLQVLSHPDSVADLLAVIFTESTSIGARTYPVTKHMLQRETVLVETPYGPLPVKVARLGEDIVNLSPEYEDCRRAAMEQGVPLKEIISAALTAARQVLIIP